MYDRIVVGTDGSETAGHAVARAGRLAALSDAEVHLVYGTGRPVASAGAGAAGFEAMVVLTAETVEQLQANLEAQADVLRADGLTVHPHLEQTSGAEAIVRVAESIDADLVVVGNRGMSGPRRYFLGSVPNAVSHQAPCSVLVVRTV